MSAILDRVHQIRWLIVVALVALIIGTALLLRAWLPNGHAVGGPLTGQTAPPTEFRFIDGQITPLQALRGQPVMIDFWATSCAICVAEMPEMLALRDELSEQFALVAVAMPYDRPDRVLDFVRRYHPSLPVALDPLGKIVDAYGPIRGTPTRVLIDRHGQIAHTLVGAIKPERLRQLLLALIDQTDEAATDS